MKALSTLNLIMLISLVFSSTSVSGQVSGKPFYVPRKVHRVSIANLGLISAPGQQVESFYNDSITESSKFMTGLSSRKVAKKLKKRFLDSETASFQDKERLAGQLGMLMKKSMKTEKKRFQNRAMISGSYNIAAYLEALENAIHLLGDHQLAAEKVNSSEYVQNYLVIEKNRFSNINLTRFFASRMLGPVGLLSNIPLAHFMAWGSIGILGYEILEPLIHGNSMFSNAIGRLRIEDKNWDNFSKKALEILERKPANAWAYYRGESKVVLLWVIMARKMGLSIEAAPIIACYQGIRDLELPWYLKRKKRCTREYADSLTSTDIWIQTDSEGEPTLFIAVGGDNPHTGKGGKSGAKDKFKIDFGSLIGMPGHGREAPAMNISTAQN